MAAGGGRAGVFVVTVFILVAVKAPLQSHGTKLPLGTDGVVLKELISHNKDLSGRMILAMRDILHRRQASGCTLDLYESQKLATKKAQLFAREMAVVAINLYKEARAFQAPELGTCTNQCEANEWLCKNGKCIPLARRCDGKNDCGDASDEGPSCMAGCGPNSFKCPTDHRCLPYSARCDSVPHCTYGIDEFCQTSCGSGQFLCRHDQRCIDFQWTCDGYPDCSDGADERLCSDEEEMATNTSQVCHQGEFRCATDNTCIPLHLVCNYVVNCIDGSDEKNCPEITTPVPTTTTQICHHGEFRCARDNICIPLYLVCNYVMNCNDGSDEKNCPEVTTPAPTTTTLQVCPPSMFQCASTRRCIYSWWKCDGHSECEDGSDELTCHHGTKCGSNHFFCLRDKTCIESSRRCNGVTDCSDTSDEVGCPTPPPPPPLVTQPPRVKFCHHGEFRCARDNTCIPLYLVCNYVVNCNDGSDERYCPETTTLASISTTESVCSGFRCRSGWCIPLEYVCDGYRDCFGADDERNCDSRTTPNSGSTSSSSSSSTQGVTEMMTTPGIRLGVTTTALVPVTFDIPSTSTTTTTITTPTTTTTTTPTTTTTTITSTTTPTTTTPFTAEASEVSCRAGFIPCTAESCIQERLACSNLARATCTIMSESVHSSCEKCIANGVSRGDCFDKSGLSVRRCRNWGWSLPKCFKLMNQLKFHHHHRG